MLRLAVGQNLKTHIRESSKLEITNLAKNHEVQRKFCSLFFKKKGVCKKITT